MAEKTCVGFKVVDVLLTPEVTSPKFQLTLCIALGEAAQLLLELVTVGGVNATDKQFAAKVYCEIGGRR